MFDSRRELIEKIRLGEDSYLECKEVRLAGASIKAPGRQSLADEMAALANTRGGVVVLGVRDKPREVLGIPVEGLDAVERYVRQISNDSIEPPLAPIIERLLLPSDAVGELPVVKVDVSRSLFVHRSPGGYLHRVGSEKRAMSTEYLGRMLAERARTGSRRFDEELVASASADDIERELAERFRTARSSSDWASYLGNLHMAGPDRGILKPTVAGVLLGTGDPRQWLPNAYIQAVAYRGVEIRAGSGDPYQLDAEDIVGPLDVQVEGACRFVAKNMRTAATKDVGRKDRPQFDMGAVFEAIVNAVAHRDYSIHGSKIRLRLFADRLEVHSPGSIPNSLRVEDLVDIQSARNETVASLLARVAVPDHPWLTTNRVTLMDRRGEGVRVILDNSERLSGRTPTYRMIGDAELLLTIYAAQAGAS